MEYVIVSLLSLYTDKFMFEISIQWHSFNVIAISLHYCNVKWPEDDFQLKHVAIHIPAN